MRKSYLKILLLFAFIPREVLAQDIQYLKSDSLMLLVSKSINDRNAGLTYSLVSDYYKMRVDSDNLHAFLEKEIYPLGRIKQSSFISFNTDTARYKLVFESRKLEFAFVLDKDDRLNFMVFLPYKGVITNKSLPVPSSNSLTSIIDKQVDSVARLYIQKSNTIGLSIGVFKNGKMHTYGYGQTERVKGKIPDEHTVFEIGSITKTLTAEILAYYVNKGTISLDDPVIKYLPDSVAANPALQKIRIVNLSNHTSGLASLPNNFFNENTDLLNPYKSYSKDMLFADLKTCKLKSIPGEVYAYSNQAVGLLGIILEKISAKTYEQLVKEIITTPLKMKSTVQFLTPALRARFAKVYDADGDEVKPWDFDALTGCGSLHSTVSDLLIYARNNIKSESSVLQKSFDLSHDITFSKGIAVGLGWHLKSINGENYYWHNGATGGSSSFLVFNKEKNIAVVVLSNASVNTDAVGMNILKNLL